MEYLAVVPVLGDPLFGPQQSMLCRKCELRFDSHGIVLCVDCWDRSRSTEAVGVGTGLAAPVRHDGPINDRNPRSRCIW
jgi:hypothetical protein